MPSAAPYSAGRPSPASASPAMAASSSTSVWSGMQLGMWRSIAGLRSSQAPTTGASRAHIASPVAASSSSHRPARAPRRRHPSYRRRTLQSSLDDLPRGAYVVPAYRGNGLTASGAPEPDRPPAAQRLTRPIHSQAWPAKSAAALPHSDEVKCAVHSVRTAYHVRPPIGRIVRWSMNPAGANQRSPRSPSSRNERTQLLAQ